MDSNQIPQKLLLIEILLYFEVFNFLIAAAIIINLVI